MSEEETCLAVKVADAMVGESGLLEELLEHLRGSSVEAAGLCVCCFLQLDLVLDGLRRDDAVDARAVRAVVAASVIDKERERKKKIGI